MSQSGKIPCKACGAEAATLVASYQLFGVEDASVRREKCKNCGKTLTFIHSKIPGALINLVVSKQGPAKQGPSGKTRQEATEAMQAMVPPAASYLRGVLESKAQPDKVRIELGRWVMDWGLSKDEEAAREEVSCEQAQALDALFAEPQPSEDQ